MGRVTIEVVEGRNLAAKDIGGSSDPYVKLHLAGRESKTKVIKHNLNPRWAERFTMYTSDTANPMLRIEVLDKDFFGHDHMGSYTLNLGNLVKDQPNDMWVDLQQTTRGQLHIIITQDFGRPPAHHGFHGAAGAPGMHPTGPGGYPPAGAPPHGGPPHGHGHGHGHHGHHPPHGAPAYPPPGGAPYGQAPAYPPPQHQGHHGHHPPPAGAGYPPPGAPYGQAPAYPPPQQHGHGAPPPSSTGYPAPGYPQAGPPGFGGAPPPNSTGYPAYPPPGGAPEYPGAPPPSSTGPGYPPAPGGHFHGHH